MFKFTILIIIFASIFAPGAQNLALDMPYEPETTSYIPKAEKLIELFYRFPVRLGESIREAIPLSKQDWQRRGQQLSETWQGIKRNLGLEETPGSKSNIFYQIGNFLTQAKEAIWGIMLRFYEKFYLGK